MKIFICIQNSIQNTFLRFFTKKIQLNWKKLNINGLQGIGKLFHSKRFYPL